jgi:hypothetical protein
MVTTQQATGLGVNGTTLHRLEKAGHLDRVRRGVYAATTATRTAAREEQAAWLTLNADKPAWQRPPLDPDGGVLSHQSAAQLHGLGELVNDRITLTTPRRRTSRDPDLWFKCAPLASDDVALVDGLPVTTALRTICDLLNQHVDGSHIATIIRQAVEANLVRMDVLAEHIEPYALRYGVRRPGDGEALLDQLLAEIGTTVAQLAYRPAPPRTNAISELALVLAKRTPVLANPSTSAVLAALGAGAADKLAALNLHTLDQIAALYAGSAEDDGTGNDDRHGSDHARELPRIPTEQGTEQSEPPAGQWCPDERAWR